MKALTAAIVGATLTFSGIAYAQDKAQDKYPSKPIRMIVGYAPGGGSDIMGRLMAPQITEALGQQVVVENRAGQAQNIAAEYIVRQPADGYTLFLSSAALGVNATLYPKLNYDPVKDFIPVAVFATAANLLLTHPSLPARNVREFIAVIRKNPGKMNYSSSGSGSTQHLSGEMLKLFIKGDFTHIPYKGTGPSLTALASGEVEFSFSNIPAAQPMLSRMRVLGITSEKRSSLMPEVPTLIESGLPGFVTQTWYGILVPRGTPQHIVDTLNRVAVNAVKREDFRNRILQMGSDPVAESPGYFRKMLAEEIERWGKVVRASGIKP